MHSSIHASAYVASNRRFRTGKPLLPTGDQIIRIEDHRGPIVLERDTECRNGRSQAPQILRLCTSTKGNQIIPLRTLVWTGCELYVDDRQTLLVDVICRKRRSNGGTRCIRPLAEASAEVADRIRKAVTDWNRWHRWGALSERSPVAVRGLSSAESAVYVFFSGGEREYVEPAHRRAALRAEPFALSYLRKHKQASHLLREYRLRWDQYFPNRNGNGVNHDWTRRNTLRRVMHGLGLPIRHDWRHHPEVAAAWNAVCLALFFGWDPLTVATAIQRREGDALVEKPVMAYA